MTAFDQLHPALQHHVVNSLQWRELRPFQEQVIPPVLAGETVLVLAPTAGGKTEAAVFPVLSRMLAEDWRGLSVLYVCPIKALLNDLEPRLSRYLGLVGRRVGLWHGDTPDGERRRMLAEPPDLLLTTPESLEVMLVGRRADPAVLFANLRAVIVDEIHAFAGDDRGWHLLGVLQRISRLAGKPPQRVGLSATVGNPEELLTWLRAGSTAPAQVIGRPQPPNTQAEVTLDYVGSLENAATVIARLHRGEKRLVFIDSRSRAEELGAILRAREVKVGVVHSSLSRDQRHQATTAFTEGEDCVLVATSVMELGVDLGDLDRVIQVDAPASVSGFLQRMGRTGRRAGATPNCLFLATRDESLMQAAGLLRLWSEGFVEHVTPPPHPYHVFAQQLMALMLQLRGLPRSSWEYWLGGVPAFDEMRGESAERLIRHALDEGLFWEEEGILWFGERGERAVGKWNFMDLLSLITSAPEYTVKAGRAELGIVPEAALVHRHDLLRPVILSLGGRSWRVRSVDDRKRVAYVEATAERGRTRWSGSGVPLSYDLCHAIRRGLVDEAADPHWSQRATERMAELRGEFGFLEADRDALVRDINGTLRWWTFAGLRANAGLAAVLEPGLRSRPRADNLALSFEEGVAGEVLTEVVAGLSEADPLVSLAEAAAPDERFIKFQQFIPAHQLADTWLQRTFDPSVMRLCLQRVTGAIA